AMSYWTQMPNMHDVHFGASLAHQWNRDTTEDTGRAGFMTLYGGRPFSMSAFYSQAKGPAIEYRRDRVGAEVRYQARHNMEAAVAVTHDQIDYGNAEVRNYAVRGMLNFRWDLNNSGRSGMRASVLAAKDGKDVLGDRNMDLTDRVRDLSDTLQNAAVVTAVAMSDLLGVLAQSGGINQDQVIQNVGAIVEVLSGVDQQILEQTAQTLSENGLNEAQKQTLIDLAGDVVSGEATTEDVNQGLLKIIDQSTDPDSPEVLPPLGAEPGSQDSENINSDENVAKIQEMHAKINMVLDILAKHNNALERAALSYGRQQALAAMRDVDIPIPGLGIHLRLTPATLLAAGHVLAKPPSPTAPLTLRNQKEVMEPWILSQAMGPLGIEGEPSYDQVVGKLYGMIEDRLREQLKTHVAGALAEFIQTQSPETGAAVIDSLVQSLSPELQAEVRQDVADPVKAVLLDPELSAAMKSGKIIDIVIEKAITALKETDNGAFQRNLEQLVAALADMMRHEINRALIHLILASEALDEVTVNRGLPPADLSRQMLMNSFNKLDERHRGRVNDKLKALARKMDAESLENSRRLEAGLVAAARERIESLQRQESWPQNFSIQVAESSWPGLIAVYGEEGTAGLFRNLRDEFRKQPKLARLAVVLEFDPKSAGTSIVPRPRQGELLIVLRGLEPTPLETPERRLERIDKFVSNLPKGAVRSMIAD
ncbi:MAG: hypothetical protein HY611_01490, partial [Elusimicrobia bacterium]|nr:hypothetical protein [Elusimicrobiota bacterium]